jgi:transposase
LLSDIIKNLLCCLHSQMGKRSKSDTSHLRARAAAHGDGVRHPEFKRSERALALRYISLGVSVKTAARAHGVLPQTIQKWRERAAAGVSLADAPRSGRSSKMAPPETQRMLDIVHEPATGSLRKAAAQLAATGGPAVASSTIQRNLINQQQVFRVARRTPLLTPSHREARMAWSEQNAHTDFYSIMFTDSKYFRCWPQRERAGAWQHKSDPRPTAPQPKHGPALHVYLGVTAYGATGLIVVTGGSKTNTTYINTKLKSPAPYRGMCAREYKEVVLPQLAAAGNQICSGRRRYVRSWQLQQDGANQHTTADSLSTVRALVPGGAFEWWPANSPDLSLIENVWAWMDAQLRLRPQCMTVDELTEALGEIVQRLTPSFLQPYFDSMPRRLQACIAADGAAI